MKLTERVVRSLALQSGEGERIIFDGEIAGLGVRLRAGGSRVWVFQYKLGEKSRRMTLGAISAIDAVKARDTAKDLYARVRLGQDPQGERNKNKATAAETFEAVAELYLAHQVTELRSSSYGGVKRHLMVHAKPLHRRQLGKIDRREIATVVATVAKNTGITSANRIRTSLSALYTWAVHQGIADNSISASTPSAWAMPRNAITGSQSFADSISSGAAMPAQRHSRGVLSIYGACETAHVSSRPARQLAHIHPDSALERQQLAQGVNLLLDRPRLPDDPLDRRQQGNGIDTAVTVVGTTAPVPKQQTYCRHGNHSKGVEFPKRRRAGDVAETLA
jgi:Arm DNA-binding domain/Phage integrase central domain